MPYRHGYRPNEARDAARGASLLDEVAPGWAERVDAGRLAEEPVLSQVFGIEPADAHGYEAWVPERFHELVYHGLIAGDAAKRARLALAWSHQVGERLRGEA
jgi:hypothetical protein